MDAVSNPVITFFDEEYKTVEGVRFDAKTEDVSITNRNEDKTLSMFLHQDCFWCYAKVSLYVDWIC